LPENNLYHAQGLVAERKKLFNQLVSIHKALHNMYVTHCRAPRSTKMQEIYIATWSKKKKLLTRTKVAPLQLLCNPSGLNFNYITQ